MLSRPPTTRATFHFTGQYLARVKVVDGAVDHTFDNSRGMVVAVEAAAIMVDPLLLLKQLQNELAH